MFDYKEFRQNDFQLLPLIPETGSNEQLGQFNRLPMGVETTDKILRRIEWRRLTRPDLKLIWDEKFSKNRPIEWIARVICLVVDSIEQEPVYEPFAASGYKIIPPIVQEITLSDTGFILFCGHINEFGSEIKNVRTQCIDPMCEKKQVIPVVSLKRLMVEYSEANHHHLVINLEDGIMLPRKGEEHIQDHYSILQMRYPVLKDALKYQDFYRSNDQGDFYERIYGDCIESLSTNTGETLEPERLIALGTSIIKKLSGNDSSILEGELNNVPALLTVVKEVCQYCSDDIPVIVPQSFLYPKRR